LLIRIFGDISNIDQKSFEDPPNSGAIILDQEKRKRREGGEGSGYTESNM
jgi:hypothetical protein